MASLRYPRWMVFAVVVGCSIVSLNAKAIAGGWVDKRPAKMVQMDPGPGKRNPLFYVGEEIRFALKGDAAVRYEVRDYWGAVVEEGKSAPLITFKKQPPGWYKVYLFAAPIKQPVKLTKDEVTELELLGKSPDPKEVEAQEKEWAVRQEVGDACGGTTFVVFRDDRNFPKLPDKSVPGSANGKGDEVIRGVAGIGPQRLYCDLNAPSIDEEIKRLEIDVALDKEYYLPHDPTRKRSLMLAFSNGTKGKLEGVKKVVEHFKGVIECYEPRNEPNFGSGGADFVTNELKPFYETVKSVDPKLKVMGPGTVAIGPQLLPWLEDFFNADGGKYIDVFSFHAYNSINGDLFLARWSMDSLAGLLKKYGLEKIEKWQTEQGYFACVYGVYQPHLQGRWTMLEMMVYEQYGIPKEHNHLWYDRSHGFWDFPTWWENDDGSFNPAVPLMRVWAEELYSKSFTSAFDLGLSGNKLFLGSLFTGKERRVAAFMSAGETHGTLQLKVTGGDSLKTVSAFGVESSLKVEAGVATLNVPELPLYVELANGQEITPIPQDFGANLAMQPGVSAAASGTGTHPVDVKIPNDIAKITNGKFENWYWLQQSAEQPWMDDTKEFPAWVEVRLPKKQSIGRVVIYAGVPWQWMGTLLDYELQINDEGGQWKTIEHVKQDPATFKVLTPVLRCGVDSFSSDRWIFNHAFPPVMTDKMRLLVHNTTFGGGATKDVADTGGQTGPHQLMLREVEIYAK